MATNRKFNEMLNDYLSYELLMEESIKRNWLLQNVEKDNNWKGGELVIPFKGGNASSFRFGALTAEGDVSDATFCRGVVSEQKEIWGTMKFESRDLMEHDGKMSEQSFLKKLPDQVEDFTEGMKEALSISLLNGAHFSKLAVIANSAAGVITPSNPERFTIGQKVVVSDGTVTKTGYVKTIDMNAGTVALVTTRGGSTVVDFSAANAVAVTGACYYEGANTAANQFTSLKSQLLSLANGGTANLFGKSKLAYPYLQALNVAGGTITATNILDKLFDALVSVRRIGKGNADKLLVSYKHLGSIMKLLESKASAYRHVDTKVSAFGYTEIEVMSVKGSATIVAINELDDDCIMILDMKAMKLHSNGFFKKQTSPEGLSYHTIRSETGYSYIVDLCFFGEFVLNRPSICGIVHSISY